MPLQWRITATRGWRKVPESDALTVGERQAVNDKAGGRCVCACVCVCVGGG